MHRGTHGGHGAAVRPAATAGRNVALPSGATRRSGARALAAAAGASGLILAGLFAAGGAATASAGAAPACTASGQGSATTYNCPFAFADKPQAFTVPAGVSSLTVTAAGAWGGGFGAGTPGGAGELVTATLSVTPGQTLEIVTGGKGGDGGAHAGAGGYNGGATGGAPASQYGPGTDGLGGGGGGGASDIRSGSCAASLSCGLADRILVAAGGGGFAANNSPGGSGASAGRTGGGGSHGGGGATATAGGAGGTAGGQSGADACVPHSQPGGAGALGDGGAGGYGGTGDYNNATGNYNYAYSGGGGGGGLYGGGGGGGGGCQNPNAGGGGGGSGLIPAGGSDGTSQTPSDGAVTISYAAVAPTISAPAAVTFTAGKAGSVTFTSAGVPQPTMSLSGSKPSWLTVKDNGDGTETLAGTPPAAIGGRFHLTVLATNAAGTATRSVDLVVAVPPEPAFVSVPDAIIEYVGHPLSLALKASGSPTPALALVGSLPKGLSFTTKPGSGIATISGTPTTINADGQAIVVTATNKVGKATEHFRLVVLEPAPRIYASSPASFKVGVRGVAPIAVTGDPAPKVTVSGLPPGAAFAVKDGVTSITWTPHRKEVGQYRVTITATNSHGTASLPLVLRVGS